MVIHIFSYLFNNDFDAALTNQTRKEKNYIKFQIKKSFILSGRLINKISFELKL